MHKRSRLGQGFHVYLFSARFVNMYMPRTTFYLLWQAFPPGLVFHGSGLASLQSWLGMVNVDWLCSMQSEISCKRNLSFFKAVPRNRLHLYLDSSLHRISSLFSYFCLFRKAILQKKIEDKVLKFWAHFFQNAVFISYNIFFSGFGYRFELIFAS